MVALPSQPRTFFNAQIKNNLNSNIFKDVHEQHQH